MMVQYAGTMIDKYQHTGLGSETPSDGSQVPVDLGASLTLLNAIVEACPLAIVALDRNGIVRMWSRGAEEMFGSTESETVGNPLPISFELLEAQLPTTSRKAIELTWPLRNGE